ncbi:hypothetical protein MMC30_004223 [Trapelia coarctata]|nr:hypothetical protein [Trapelia coarctata]
MGRKRKRPGCLDPDEAPGSTSPKRQKNHHPTVSVNCSPGHPVLCRYYPNVQTLRQYLLSKLPHSSKTRRRKIASLSCEPKGGRLELRSAGDEHSDESDDSQLATLLDSTLVGVGEVTASESICRTKDFEFFSQQLSSTVANSLGEGSVSQPEIVDFAIWLLFNKIQRHIHRPSHLLCHGFQRASAPRATNEDHSAVAGIPGLVSAYPNPHVATLKSFPWTHLLKILGKAGDRVVLDLILDCGVFKSVESRKGNFYQLSGVPVSELPTIEKRESISSHLLNGRGGILRRTETPKTSAAPHTPTNIAFIRSRMMYARSALNAKGDVQFGLRHIHVFNRYSNHDDPEHTVHVMKYIFPRQFGLHNVFTSSVDSRETSHAFKDYTLREREIAQFAQRHNMRSSKISAGFSRSLPRRLRGYLVTLVSKLQIMHSRCSYSALLKHYCPVHYIDGREWRRSVKKLHRRSAARRLPGSTNQKAISDFVSGSSLVDAATPSEHVSAFCRAVLCKLIPSDLWGTGSEGRENRDILLHQVDRFINLRRFENLTLHNVSQKLKIRCINWLAPPKLDPSLQMSQTDHQKRKEILLEFLYYIFDSIVIPLIRSNFHVTESNAHRNRLFFFRHDLWRACTEPSLTTIKLSMFEEIRTEKARKLLDARTLGFSQIRLLPKASGLRPIMNLRRRATKVQGGKTILGRSINSVMAPVYNMLSYEKAVQPSRLASALFSVGDIYPRVKAFQAQLSRDGKVTEELHFVKVDVQSCFDTIPQRRVIKLMERLCSETEYRIARHAEIRPSESHSYQAGSGPGYKAARKFIARAKPGHDFASFEESLDNIAASAKKNTIYIDSVVETLQDKEQLLDLLEEHVERNVVKIGKKFFRQKQGIPQGSVLSSLLCSFFYADFENEHLGFLNNPRSLLLRLIDDFLLITTSKADAVRFLGIMDMGNEQYGVKIRMEKSLTNFDMTSNKVSVPCLTSSTSFPYCGIGIDTKTLEITKDRTRRTDTVLADSLTVETSRVPGQTFHRKAMNAFKIQIHAMFLDTDLNSLATVLSTIYQNMLESAMKLYRYAKSIRPEVRPPSSLMIRTIEDLSHLAVVLIQSKHESHRSSGYKCGVTKAQIEW